MTKTRVVICAAGSGRRLGIGIPKCLAEVDGTPIIRHQLDILTRLADDIVVVVGYRADAVRREINRYDVGTVFNDGYADNTVADSVRLGAHGSQEVLAVDGDVLFTECDMKKVIAERLAVCVTGNASADGQVYVTVQGGLISAFHREKRTESDMEWAGICKVPTNYFIDSGYVYEKLEKWLPLPCVVIDSVEIDTVADLAEAERWIKK